MMEIAEREEFKNIKKEISILNDFLNFTLCKNFNRSDVFFHFRKNIL